MQTTADSVVVEIVARLEKAERDINKLDATFTKSAGSNDRSAKALEGVLNRLGQNSTTSFVRMGSSATKAANDIDKATARTANATRNLGRQVSDVGAQLAGGQSPFLIFAQQAPQVADALADTGGRAAKVAAFFAGPWGAALLAAGSVLGTLIPKLLDASSAADTMTEAQRDLANFVDTTTGAINRQTLAVQRLAAAQARQGDIESGTRAHAEARGSAIGAVRAAGGEREPVYTAGFRQPDAVISDPLKQRLRDLAAEAVRARQPINDFAIAVRQAVGDRPEYRELVRTVTAQAAAAVTAAQSVQKLKAEQAVLTGTATAQQRALLGLGQATTGLVEKQVALATATTNLERARARLALVEEQGRGIQDGDSKALAQYRNDLTAANTAVNAAEAAERADARAKRETARETREAAKAERERIKVIRDTARAERELLSLRSDVLGAKGDLTSDSRLQDEFSRQRIELDRSGRTSELQERKDRGELTGAEFTERKKLVDEITELRLNLVNRNEAIRFANEQLDASHASIGNQRELLQAQEGLATTSKQRRDVQLKLLDLELEERRLAAQKVVDLASTGKASEQDAAVARGTLDALPKIRGLTRQRIEQDNQGPLGQYVAQLRANTDDMSEALESVQVRGFQALEDGFAGVVSGTETVADAFKKMAASIIADLARIAIQRAIVGILPGVFGGGSGLGAVVSAGASLLGGGKDISNKVVASGRVPGFANGGTMVIGGNAGTDRNVLSLNGSPIARVSAGERLDISPAGQRAVRPQGGGGTVQQIFVDARGSVMNDQFARMILQQASRMDADAARQTLSAANQSAPAALAYFQRNGTTRR